MKGGTVVLAASPFVPTFAQGFAARKVDTGLEDWLAHHGITIEESMVLDSQSAALPVPVEREVGGVRVRELRMFDYTYFVDARGEGLADGSAPPPALTALSMSWASPNGRGTETERACQSVYIPAGTRKATKKR